jgi:hypothetical protein
MKSITARSLYTSLIYLKVPIFNLIAVESEVVIVFGLWLLMKDGLVQMDTASQLTISSNNCQWCRVLCNRLSASCCQVLLDCRIW